MHALLFYCWESLPWCLPPATFAVERAAPTYDLSKYGHDITVPVVQIRDYYRSVAVQVGNFGAEDINRSSRDVKVQL